jgi:hypothetical protein
MKRLVAAVVAALFAFGSLPVLAADGSGSPPPAQSTTQKAKKAKKVKKKSKRHAKRARHKTKRTAHRTAKRVAAVDRSDAQRQGKE